MSTALAVRVPQKLQWQDTNQDKRPVRVSVRDQGVRADSSVSPSLRQFYDPATRLPGSRATPVAHVLWWPRRSLATLDRKSRQGRKAATVSIDAGAEVNRRGHHPNQKNRLPMWRRLCAHSQSGSNAVIASALPDAASPHRLPGNARASRSARAP